VPAGRHLRCRRGELVAIATVQDDLGAMVGEALRDRKSDALGRTCDERPLAGQIEQFECHVNPLRDAICLSRSSAKLLDRTTLFRASGARYERLGRGFIVVVAQDRTEFRRP
jgi:hypothetical protein